MPAPGWRLGFPTPDESKRACGPSPTSPRRTKENAPYYGLTPVMGCGTTAAVFPMTSASGIRRDAMCECDFPLMADSPGSEAFRLTSKRSRPQVKTSTIQQGLPRTRMAFFTLPGSMIGRERGKCGQQRSKYQNHSEAPGSDPQNPAFTPYPLVREIHHARTVPTGWALELTRYIHLNPVRVRRMGLGKDGRHRGRP